MLEFNTVKLLSLWTQPHHSERMPQTPCTETSQMMKLSTQKILIFIINCPCINTSLILIYHKTVLQTHRVKRNKCVINTNKHSQCDDVIPLQHSVSTFLIQLLGSTHTLPVPPLTSFYVRHPCLWRKRVMGNQLPLQSPRGTEECHKTHHHLLSSSLKHTNWH